MCGQHASGGAALRGCMAPASQVGRRSNRPAPSLAGRCGCPWWTTDDWDARCIRCGWDCESGGYDDNSQPLPKYKAKWEHFTALIREGRTAPYTKRAKQ